MLAPTYVSENSPRAIRGFLVGFFQLLLVMGGMMAYFINYGALLHLPVSTPNTTIIEHILNDTAFFAAYGHVDGSAGLSVNMPSTLILQHALLPGISAMASFAGPMGQS